MYQNREAAAHVHTLNILGRLEEIRIYIYIYVLEEKRRGRRTNGGQQ